MRTRLLPLPCALLLVLAVLGSADETVRLDLGAGVSLDLARLPAGTFRQGSPAAEGGRGADETPREVTLGADFLIGRTEVTRGQFERFVAETGYRTEAEKGSSGGFGLVDGALVQRPDFNWRNPGFAQTAEHPVVIVTYDDALAFAEWLSRKARRRVALPTEAQWEYAARAGSASRFHAGDAEDEARTIAWFKANSGDGTRPVAQKQPNRWGLHDMSGNAYEWCRDWYAPAYAPGPATDPEETRSTLSDKPRRVLRGGSFLKDAKACRSAARYRNTPGSRNADNGFRVVASVEEIAASAPPPAPAAATAPSASEGQSSGWLSILAAFGLFAAAAVFLLAMAKRILRRLLGTNGLQTGYPDVTAQLGPDGFWLRAPKVGARAKLRYRVVVDGVPQTGEIANTGGGRGRGVFVYTGGKPSAVEVLGVGAAAGLAATTARGLRGADDSGPEEPPETPPFGGYPSAY